MKKVFITPEVVEYVKCNQGSFNGIMPKIGDSWNVEIVKTYPSVNYGEPIIEIVKEKKFMRLPAEMFYSKNYAKYLSDKYKTNKNTYIC